MIEGFVARFQSAETNAVQRSDQITSGERAISIIGAGVGGDNGHGR